MHINIFYKLAKEATTKVNSIEQQGFKFKTPEYYLESKKEINKYIDLLNESYPKLNERSQALVKEKYNKVLKHANCVILILDKWQVKPPSEDGFKNSLYSRRFTNIGTIFNDVKVLFSVMYDGSIIKFEEVTPKGFQIKRKKVLHNAFRVSMILDKVSYCIGEGLSLEEARIDCAKKAAAKVLAEEPVDSILRGIFGFLKYSEQE